MSVKNFNPTSHVIEPSAVLKDFINSVEDFQPSGDLSCCHRHLRNTGIVDTCDVCSNSYVTEDDDEVNEIDDDELVKLLSLMKNENVTVKFHNDNDESSQVLYDSDSDDTSSSDESESEFEGRIVDDQSINNQNVPSLIYNASDLPQELKVHEECVLQNLINHVALFLDDSAVKKITWIAPFANKS